MPPAARGTGCDFRSPIATEAHNPSRIRKTLPGARRRTVIVRVLESLRRHRPELTLSSVIVEVRHWSHTGQNCFAKLLATFKLTPCGRSALNLPLPDG